MDIHQNVVINDIRKLNVVIYSHIWLDCIILLKFVLFSLLLVLLSSYRSNIMSFREFLRKIALPVVVVSGFEAARRDVLSPRRERDGFSARKNSEVISDAFRFSPLLLLLLLFPVLAHPRLRSAADCSIDRRRFEIFRWRRLTKLSERAMARLEIRIPQARNRH